VHTLVQLEQAIRESWGPDTVDPDDGWSADNPARGHCDVTSLVVNDLLGGEFLTTDVYVDGEKIMAHTWNRLASGVEVDLTRDQFRNGEVLGESLARLRPAASALADPSHPDTTATSSIWCSPPAYERGWAWTSSAVRWPGECRKGSRRTRSPDQAHPGTGTAEASGSLRISTPLAA
jgi:hypothetical protein